MLTRPFDLQVPISHHQPCGLVQYVAQLLAHLSFSPSPTFAIMKFTILFFLSAAVTALAAPISKASQTKSCLQPDSN